MLVYIIRHGESETNLRKSWTGWLDAKLTEKGKEDAKKAGAFLKNIAFDKIFASDLKRALVTAQTATSNGEIETSPLLREIKLGSLEGKPIANFSEADWKIISTGSYDYFGGETSAEFKGRILQFKTLLEELNCERVAVFSHAGWIRGMFNAAMDSSIPSGKLICQNCTIAVFEYKEGVWRLHSWINPA